MATCIPLSAWCACVELTQLIQAARGGDRGAAERLFTAVYGDLHRIAAGQLRDQPAAMATTSLVHEAYFRLAKPDSLELSDRQHFYAVAARAMRQILIDHARARLAQKRGSGVQAKDLDAAHDVVDSKESGPSVLALDAALQQLESLDARLATLVELRFFGGMTLDEAADAAGVSRTTVKRDWRRARAFLHAALGDSSIA